MPTIDQIPDIIITVRDLIIAGWIPTNISPNMTPVFSTGKFDQKSTRSHQVTFSDPDEFVSGSPPSGYSGIRADGSGGSQLIEGTMQIGHWSHREMEDIQNFNPKDIVYQMARETRRILLEAGSNPGGQLHTLAPVSYTRVTDTSRSPVAYQGIVIVNYVYDTHP